MNQIIMLHMYLCFISHVVKTLTFFKNFVKWENKLSYFMKLKKGFVGRTGGLSILQEEIQAGSHNVKPCCR